VFIVSFNAIIGDAESRNHTFLEIIKAEMKALAKTKRSNAQETVREIARKRIGRLTHAYRIINGAFTCFSSE